MVRAVKGIFNNPIGIFAVYLPASCAVIIGFLMIFPPEPAPLRVFSMSWRFTLAAQEYINLFPAIVVSALVIPFGLKVNQENPLDLYFTKFIDRIQGSLFSALGGAVIYGLLFFLALPLARSTGENMRFKGLLYNESRAKAELFAGREEWPDAARFVALCELIWPGNPEIENFKDTVYIELDAYYLNKRPPPASSTTVVYREKDSPTPGLRKPVNAAEALEFSEAAYLKERYYDAHWLATLAGELARPGSVESRSAVLAASKAWNIITSLAPSAQEKRAYELYTLKHSGYEAFQAEDWIRAYYIFTELSAFAPEDPDVVNFLAESERNLRNTAFFADEMESTVGQVMTGVVFSIPRKPIGGRQEGRMVLRADALLTFSDVSYATGLELIAFDGKGVPVYRFTAPYVKVLPKTLGTERCTMLLLRALDRSDQDRRWEPLWEGSQEAEIGNTQVMLDVSYENFLFMSHARRGLDNFLIGDLFAAERNLSPYGFIPQVFQAEILSRLAEPLLFLPALLLAIILGWRFRAKKPPRILGIPLLILLPLLFNGVAHIYRILLHNLGIWAVLVGGFSSALAFFIGGAVLLFILTLLWLTAQKN
ncbi:MAG: hypothetical protein LBG76_04865 [Treponema sp.]|jgi:hypothetical protein|nr:hypothetical protein [Treponema sp.]